MAASSAKLILTFLAIFLPYLVNDIEAQTGKPAISSHMAKFLCGQTRQFMVTGEVQKPITRTPTSIPGLACGWYVKRGKANYSFKPCSETTEQTRACTVAVKPRAEPMKSYKGYKVWSLTAADIGQHIHLTEMQVAGYDFWKGPSPIGEQSHVMVSPEQNRGFQEIIAERNYKPVILIEDVQSMIDGNTRTSRSFDLFNFNDWQNIHGFFDTQQQRHPGVAKVIQYGMSYECRPLKALRISRSGDTKPIIFVESGMHAREWISPAVALYLANQLLNGNDATVKGWLNDFDFYIVSPLNIDGYDFTFISDRLWRKTRTPTSNPKCFGVDPNRNWEFKWGVGQADSEPCSDSFKGRQEMSEPFIKRFATFIKNIGHRLAFYLDLHAYSQVMIIPYAYSAVHTPTYDAERAVALKAIKAIKDYKGTVYKAGTLKEVLGIIVGGSSMDWVKWKFPKTMAIALEMPPKNGAGGSGFIPSPDTIQQTSQEVVEGLKVYVNHLRSKLRGNLSTSHYISQEQGNPELGSD